MARGDEEVQKNEIDRDGGGGSRLTRRVELHEELESGQTQRISE